MTTTTETSRITNDQIHALRDEAAQSGDSAQVECCDRALFGNPIDIAACQRVVDAAAAQSDADDLVLPSAKRK